MELDHNFVSRRTALFGAAGAAITGSVAIGATSRRRRDAGAGAPLRMPAEWEPHARCWMAWPDPKIWFDEPEALNALRTAHARLIATVARFEPVALVTPTSEVDDVKRRFSSSAVEVVDLPTDDIWLRDTGPLFTCAPGRLGATTFRFNAWGGKNDTHAEDARLAARIALRQRVEPMALGLTTEGGALEVDGRGTLITTETAILNPNRNPTLHRREAAEMLKRGLGVSHVVWLPGSMVDQVTDGHVDGIAKFVRPGVILAEIARDPQHPEYAVLVENLRALRLARDARGDRFEIVTVARPSRVRSDTASFCDSYVNTYLANGAVVMPAFGDATSDEAAQQTFRRCWPHRAITPINVDGICEGGGGIHCVTQQQPI